ncbi:MAG TPA: choice-of-anchor B family protein [Bacteroidia bacterium]|nr:choice-of-anchor B family protein [Bacteroidia bacterium]HNT80143.1 choice-of-anchor B family protein [Bacteroidia bacterium]
MKRILFILLMAMCVQVMGQPFNLTLKSIYTYPNTLSNIWGYTDSLGNEYALVGEATGLSIVDVTNPVSPTQVAFIPGPGPTTWREVKTWGKYAYVTTESGNIGLQIVDLSLLPASAPFKNWQGTGAIAGQLETIHALHVDDGYVYLYGTNLFHGAALVVDLADPWNPVYTGHTPDLGSTTPSYIHDGYVRNDTLYGGYIYAGYFSVTDVTNKSNPVTVVTQNTPNNFTHNTWLNDAGNVLMTTDEVNDSYLAAYDISDINNIKELDRIQVNPGTNSIVHNTYVLNDYAVTSWYTDGVAIVDVHKPDNLVVVGWYDTYPQGTGPGFSGCWGVYPFFPSGTIVCSDIQNGMVVLTPDYVRACYLEGMITDSATGTPLNGALIEILSVPVQENSDITGNYKTGYHVSGTYTVQVSKAGYFTKTINNVQLQSGVVTNLNVQLVCVNCAPLSGQVINSITNNPVANANVQIYNATNSFDATTNANGEFNIGTFIGGNYNVVAGQWGYVTNCQFNVSIGGGPNPYVIAISPGIYDDFTFDYNWTVSGISLNAWERGVPVLTTNQGSNANPGIDSPNDCGELAFVTDNGGGGPWDNDVDGGNTVLTSPIFDPTIYANPDLKYARWFYDGGNVNGAPNDTMRVKISNGTNTVTVETILPNSPGNGNWVNRSYNLASLISISNTMQLIVEIEDYNPGNIVEGGLDFFRIEGGFVGVEENNFDVAQLSVYPNPGADALMINYTFDKFYTQRTLMISDMSGRIVMEQTLDAIDGSVNIGSLLSSGNYMAYIITESGKSKPIKFTRL